LKRKTRKRTQWFPKEDGYICGTCKAKGDCSDEKNSTEPFFWDEEAKKITCVKCGHQLTTKEELEDKFIVEEIQRYGFWLRFASEHFIPCKNCQEVLHKALFRRKATWYINDDKMGVDLAISTYGNICYFSFRWIEPALYFTPCDNCIRKLRGIIKDKELHIGNDVKPPVELWRKWEHIEEDK